MSSALIYLLHTHLVYVQLDYEISGTVQLEDEQLLPASSSFPWEIPGPEVNIWDGSGRQRVGNNNHKLFEKDDHIPLGCRYHELLCSTVHLYTYIFWLVTVEYNHSCLMVAEKWCVLGSGT